MPILEETYKLERKNMVLLIFYLVSNNRVNLFIILSFNLVFTNFFYFWLQHNCLIVLCKNIGYSYSYKLQNKLLLDYVNC